MLQRVLQVVDQPLSIFSLKLWRMQVFRQDCHEKLLYKWQLKQLLEQVNWS